MKLKIKIVEVDDNRANDYFVKILSLQIEAGSIPTVKNTNF